MDLSSLKTFIEVVNRGSFSRVARDHNVSPSSVSRTLASLEEELGVRLFQRSTRQLEITEAGSLYFDQIESSVGEIEQAGYNAIQLSGSPQGTLRITAPVDFGQFAIAPLLPIFSARYPEIKFDLLFADAVLDLLTERIDIAIRLSPPSDSLYIGTKLFDESFVVCASQAYIEQHGGPRLPEEVIEHECMHFPMADYTQWCFQDKNSCTEVVKVSGNLQVTNSIILRDCAMAGMGVVLLPHWITWKELESRQLINLFPDYTVTVSDLKTAAWLLYPSRSHLPLKVRVFVDFMKTQFSNWPEEYAFAVSESQEQA